MDTRISGIVIAKDEEGDLERCLASLSFCDELIVVVDQSSIDSTYEIALRYTDKVFLRHFDSFSRQRNYALEQTSCQWVFALDADEYVNEKLKKEILSAVNEQRRFYWIPRVNWVLGKQVMHGGWYPDCQLRLFRNVTHYEHAVHELPDIKGDSGRLREAIQHKSSADSLSARIGKAKFHAELKAQENHSDGIDANFLQAGYETARIFGGMYIIKLGFLDSWRGLLCVGLCAYETMLGYIYTQRLAKPGA